MSKRKTRNYNVEFKKSAIQLALRSPSIKVAAKELGIPSATLTTWVYQFRDGAIAGESPVPETDTIDPTTAKQLKDNLAKLLEENKPLNKKIATLEEERLILKKAAYFAKEQR